MTYAVLISKNDRSGGNNAYVSNLRGDTIEDLANRLTTTYPQAEGVACWMADHATTVRSFLEQSPDDTFFCGDSGDYRYDVQVVDE
jgi:hypothetical protein